jgi:2-polyprenyl-3-methyl-5-hydroxy-6-metoxy-1,4-benzoquinol methylase
MGELQTRFYDTLAKRHPMLLPGTREARAVNPDLVDREFERCLQWVTNGFGPEGLERVTNGYLHYTMEVNRSQIAYEAAGRYAASSFAEVDQKIYQQQAYMNAYYWGVFTTHFCWSHHAEILEFFIERFVKRTSGKRLLEVAPGHGSWGLMAVAGRPDATLEGRDISPASLDIAPRLAAGANLEGRCTYRVADATRLEADAKPFDEAICCYMLEHLEDPAAFLKGLAGSLVPGATAFVSLALTAAQPDHIYEFRKESEAIVMAEAAGFELLEARIARPHRLLPKAKKVPRVQALILRRI